MSHRFARHLMAFATALALTVVLLGAWTRLSDAGLGCPDWPTCYGHLVVPQSAQQLADAAARFPDQQVVQAKAWPEMIHRYFAGTLGLTIFLFAILAWRARGRDGFPRKQAFLMVVLVVFQALLGMWTVTMKLHPAVVMSHLLGGLTTLSLCFLAWRRLRGHPQEPAAGQGLRRFGLAALLVLVAQIALGGWTSANYAALVCGQGLPVCQSGWSERLDFAEGFRVHDDGHHNFEYGVKSLEGRTAIHVSHRFGAMLTALVLAGLALGLARIARYRGLATVLGLMLLVQLSLGVANIWFVLPLPVAVAHNGGAALLLLTLVAVNYRLQRGRAAAY